MSAHHRNPVSISGAVATGMCITADWFCWVLGSTLQSSWLQQALLTMEPSLQPFRLHTLLLHPTSILQIHKSKGACQPAIGPHAYNLSTQEAEAREHLQVLGQLDRISKTLKIKEQILLSLKLVWCILNKQTHQKTRIKTWFLSCIKYMLYGYKHSWMKLKKMYNPVLTQLTGNAKSLRLPPILLHYRLCSKT